MIKTKSKKIDSVIKTTFKPFAGMLLILAFFAMPQAVIGGETTSSSATLNWTAPGDDGYLGIATRYDIRMSLSPINGENWPQAAQIEGEAAPLPGGQADSFVVQNLLPNTVYYFAMRTSDEVGNWSEISNIVSKQTAATNLAPMTITDLTVDDYGDYNVDLGWTVPDNGSGGPVGYQIRYSNELITSENWDNTILLASPPTPATPGSRQTFSVTGLGSGTEYYFAMRTVDGSSQLSDISNLVVVQTTGEPTIVTDLQASTGDNDGEITLSWNAPADGYYRIKYTQDTTGSSVWAYIDSLSETAGRQNYVITGLQPADSYWVAIQLYNGDGTLAPISEIVVAEAGFGFSAGDDQNPEIFELSQNFPNPFNPTTNINYTIGKREHVQILILNILGQITNRLVDEIQDAGEHTVIWDGLDLDGKPVATGVYIYRLVSDSYSQSRKMILLK